MRVVVIWVVLVLASSALVAEEKPAGAPVNSPKAPAILNPPRPVSPVEPPPALDLDALNSQLEKLKAERQALRTERQTVDQLRQGKDGALEERSTQLRIRVGQALNQLKERTEKEKAGPPIKLGALPPIKNVSEFRAPMPSSSDKRPPESGSEETPLPDAQALARALFQANDFAGALKAYRLVNLGGLKVDERRPIQYMMATCLRRLGQNEDAAALYREVAGSKGDEVLAECARWQLSVLQWNQDLDAKIRSLQSRLQKLEGKP